MNQVSSAFTGSFLANRYRLGNRLGRGGMGSVYMARDEVLDRLVAVKILDGDLLNDALWLREARAAARLDHPNVVRVFDSGTHEGSGFLVMELVEGKSLRDVLNERGHLSSAEVLRLGTELADAVEAVHQTGLVHCDLKPENVILPATGHPRLIDFGIARASSGTLTRPAQDVLGSVRYMAPEQASNERVDGRADVYALGTMLYEAAAGSLPFSGEAAIEIIAQRMVADAPALTSAAPHVPAGLGAVIDRMLARRPADRFAAAADVGAALRQLQLESEQHTLRVASRIDTATQTRPRVVDRVEPAKPPPLNPQPSATANRTAPIPRPHQPGKRARKLRRRAGFGLPAVLVLLLLTIPLAVAVVTAASFLQRPSSQATPASTAPPPPAAAAPAPAVIGLGLQDAVILLRSAGLRPQDAYFEPAGAANRGRVIRQDPEPGTPLRLGAPVNLVLGSPQ